MGDGSMTSKLTLIGKSNIKNSSGEYYFKYICSCGMGYLGLRRDVSSGKTVSCGCYRRQAASLRIKGRTPAYDNSLPCCAECNFLKRAANFDEFVTKIGIMYFNLKTKGVL
jgi:hypothetical protein